MGTCPADSRGTRQRQWQRSHMVKRAPCVCPDYICMSAYWSGEELNAEWISGASHEDEQQEAATAGIWADGDRQNENIASVNKRDVLQDAQDMADTVDKGARRATCNNSIKFAAESHLEGMQNAPHSSRMQNGMGVKLVLGLRCGAGTWTWAWAWAWTPAELAPVGNSRAGRRQKLPRLISWPPMERSCSNLHSCNFVVGIRTLLFGLVAKELNSKRHSL